MGTRLRPMEVGYDGTRYAQLWDTGSYEAVSLAFYPETGQVELAGNSVGENALRLDGKQVEELYRRLGQILRSGGK